MSAGRDTRTKVLVVDDSLVMRQFLTHILNADPHITVLGAAASGEEAIEAAKRLRPDVITMDVYLPNMNGFDATRRIMETCPTPIVVVSGLLMHDEVLASFKALEAGALAFVRKPNGPGHPLHDEAVKQLLETVKLMSEVKVVRRWPRREARQVAAQPILESTGTSVSTETQLIAIGASTGGPIVLKTILSLLPHGFSIPIVIVQHIAPGFTDGFAVWLSQSSGFPVRIAKHGETLLPGQAYLAPDGLQTRVEAGFRIALGDDAPENGHRPSVSHLFRSVAAVAGRNAAGVLLTGMGRDGADELKLMKQRGALTIVQDRESSVVHGMPGEAINLNAATHVLGPSAIAAALGALSSRPDTATAAADRKS